MQPSSKLAGGLSPSPGPHLALCQVESLDRERELAQIGHLEGTRVRGRVVGDGAKVNAMRWREGVLAEGRTQADLQSTRVEPACGGPPATACASSSCCHSQARERCVQTGSLMLRRHWLQRSLMARCTAMASMPTLRGSVASLRPVAGSTTATEMSALSASVTSRLSARSLRSGGPLQLWEAAPARELTA